MHEALQSLIPPRAYKWTIASGILLWGLYQHSQRSDLPEVPRKARPGLYSLPPSVRKQAINEIYPEDIYPGGGYADLPIGRVKYWLLGPEHGEKLVLVHGFSIPGPIWRLLAPRLADAGYRVLVFDLYGRGYSDAPYSDYTVELYKTQLALLLQYLRWEKAHIAGNSMGGPIAAAFVDQFPHLVDEKIILSAPAGLLDSVPGLNYAASPWYLSLLIIPLFKKHVRKSMGLVAGGPKDELKTIANLQADHLPSFVSVLLLTERHGPFRGQHSSFKSKHFVGKKVLILQGSQDDIVPPEHAERVKNLLPPGTSCELVYLDGAPHDIPITHADAMFREISRFLSASHYVCSS
ncbi:alpha/beta-hydrolase [Cylindrobasidium torrendii FP15055 ss-10]|uniref:Alpha/beta-hydrolase n=1 Tax=Cylindrobasidium torrendii FP15055 ss-10 TaxID=1314674 RepID=A0A0D7AY04_9AGAR|nr:alpha/beta-hydrolase [Cylindrobasidium torrendii FP15055 ss-10]